MPNYWILKTEPTTYGFDDLVREKRTTWDGVKNAVALKHIRAMKSGDGALIYHSGKQKAVVGLAKIVSDPYPDPELKLADQTAIENLDLGDLELATLMVHLEDEIQSVHGML